jgi:limonene-1,2-epoxide hydrolase
MKNTEELIRQFVASFESKDAGWLGTFFHQDILFANYGDPFADYGDPEVRGKAKVVKAWEHAFSMFETVRFETLNQAINGSVVLAEQLHHLALKGRESAPIRNMALYEMRDGRIGVWRHFTDSKYAKQLFDASRPIAS